MKKNKFVKIICTLLPMMLAVSVLFSGCGGNTSGKRDPVIYSADIAYIGHNYKENENVKGVTVFNTLEKFDGENCGKDSIWIEEDSLLDNMDYVKDLMSKTKSLLVISSTDKSSLYEKIMGERLRENITSASDFLGLLFTKVAGEEYDAVGVYGNRENLEFMAFASLYDYKSSYQGNSIKTEVYKTEKLADSFNVFALNENGYAVSYMTIVDFVDNPSYSGGEYKFQHSILQTTLLYPYISDNIVNEFTAEIDTGKDSYIIAFAPEDDFEMDKKTNNNYNFFFKRYFDISKDVEYKCVVRAAEKSFGAKTAAWGLSVLDKKGREIYTSDARNITSALDVINTQGHYVPSCNINIAITDSDNEVHQYKFAVEINQWAVAWDDDYEE